MTPVTPPEQKPAEEEAVTAAEGKKEETRGRNIRCRTKSARARRSTKNPDQFELMDQAESFYLRKG